MSATPSWGRYTELRPEPLAQIRRQTPVAYLPWGALGWRGPHLPLGGSGIIAETLAERVARRVGGVLLPTTWWPIAPLPHPDSLGISGPVLAGLWDEIFINLAHAGWHIVVLLSGHYSPGHELALMDAAERAIEQQDMLVLSIPTMALVDESMLDQAALWESSLLMALRPDQVDLDALGAGPLALAASAVIGQDPRGTASASIGTRALRLAVDKIASATSQLLTEGSPAPLRALYSRRRERYQAFVERYGHDPEAAMAAWWDDQQR